MARSLKQQVETARIGKDALVDAIYACAPTTTTPFADCYKAASQLLREQYDAARHTVAELEYRAVAEGKAYLGAFGMLVWNRR